MAVDREHVAVQVRFLLCLVFAPLERAMVPRQVLTVYTREMTIEMTFLLGLV